MLPDKLSKTIFPFDWNCYFLSDMSVCLKCKCDWFWQIDWQWSSESNTIKRNFRLPMFNQWNILKYNGKKYRNFKKQKLKELEIQI